MVSIEQFLMESFAIEGIYTTPTKDEIQATINFLLLSPAALSASELVRLVKVYQPDAEPRYRKGLNVFIGNHKPPPGGIRVKEGLNDILTMATGNRHSAWTVHKLYETLHPFTDGNGRSGRTLWLWMMGWYKQYGYLRRNFLHEFYYQTLSEAKGLQ